MYDSTNDTLEHIRRVRVRLGEVITNLSTRSAVHDRSKFEEPEKSAIDRTRPLLKQMEFGTDEYTQLKREWSDHHHSVNRHHVEFHSRGLEGMTLNDLIEMLCDWQAATETHKDGDNILTSIDILAERYEMPWTLKCILINTAVEMGWLEHAPQRYIGLDGYEYDTKHIHYYTDGWTSNAGHDERVQKLVNDGYKLVQPQGFWNPTALCQKVVGKVY